MIPSKSRPILKKILYGIFVFFFLILCIPLPKDEVAYSRALYSQDNQLLSAAISSEQQWRLPFSEPVPDKLSTAIITYEDAYFYYHLGINPISMIKATWTNLRSGRVVRGASTIPMQVMRLRHRSLGRSLWNKIYESLAAIKYSVTNSKKSIIKDWASLAPFGGNTIGIKAASLRYFGTDMDNLSWGQYALLAVMPNGPAVANLTRNRATLKQKRDKLLDKLAAEGYIPSDEVALYKGEEIPTMLNKVPQHGYHMLDFVAKQHPDRQLFMSTIDYSKQLKLQELIEIESQFYKLEDIRNMAAVVIDVSQNKVVSYVGNTADKKGKFSYVDIVQSARSYGSLLKPLLYMMAIDKAHYLPGEMIEDIPTSIGDFTPLNFDKKYRGAVPVEDVITQSLNIPAVRMLQRVGLPNFYETVRSIDLAYLHRGADHYGLSIILGGGETSLWDMARLYKGIAQNALGIAYPFRSVQYLADIPVEKPKKNISFDPTAVQYTINAMADISRPREERSWELYAQNQKVAWKTGTSFGHRDAWAVGFNGKYAVAVWVGNEGGEGRFGLTGIAKAAPVMFKIFNALNDHRWFESVPLQQKKQEITICKESGRMAGNLCRSKRRLRLAVTSMKYKQCDFHQVHGISAGGQVVVPPCDIPIIRYDTVFVLPPYMAYYYKEGHLDYRDDFNYDVNCQVSTSSLAILYPQQGIKIFAPRVDVPVANSLIAKAYHSHPGAALYWFLDGKYLETTKGKEAHFMEISPTVGKHRLHISDSFGGQSEVSFEVIN